MLNIESFSQKFELVRWNFEIITSNWLKDENNVGFFFGFFPQWQKQASILKSYSVECF